MQSLSMTTPDRFLPYGRQQVSDDDLDAVIKVLKSDYLTTGPVTAAFEREFAAYVQTPYAAVCANGTAALHLCAMALQLNDQDIVIVPSVTFLATANGPHLTGAEICFCDVDENTGLMTTQHLQAALSRLGTRAQAVKAVFPVHLNGQCVDIASIRRMLPESIAIIEDACHALGGKATDGLPVGSSTLSTASTFSFHPVKSLTTGEGGMVTTQDESFDKAVRLLRNHGMIRDPEAFLYRDAAFDHQSVNPWYYEMHKPGYNYRATDIGCALGLSQLRRLDESIEQRRQLVRHYSQCLQSLAPLVQPITQVHQNAPGWHLCVVLIDFEAASRSRRQIMATLRSRGIGTQVHYIPIHRQPYYRQRYGKLTLKGADSYYQRCLSLPLFPEMTCDNVEMVVDTLGESLIG